MLWKKGVSTSAESCFCSLICFMAGDEFVGRLVCEEQCLWVTGQWFLVMSEEVSLPLMSFQTVSAGSEGRVCTSSPSSPDWRYMLIYCRRRRKTENRKDWKKFGQAKKGKNMMLERKKKEAAGVAPWVVWESTISYIVYSNYNMEYFFITIWVIMYTKSLSPYRPVNTPMKLFCSFNANI